MATKKNEVIELKPLVITQPALYEVSIQGLDSILFNRMLSKDEVTEGNDSKEGYEEREWRIWKKKAYVDDNGILYVPGENIHECMKQGSQYWGQKIPGEGNKTYTDLIASAVICESISLGVHIDSEGVIPYDKMVNGNPSKGKKSGAKVLKVRPLLRPWGGTYRMHVFDARLTPDVLNIIIAYAGTFRGLCDWRPQFGRFELTGIKKI